jgi:hypothetical protein
LKSEVIERGIRKGAHKSKMLCRSFLVFFFFILGLMSEKQKQEGSTRQKDEQREPGKK